jgi:hypothetical protein
MNYTILKYMHHLCILKKYYNIIYQEYVLSGNIDIIEKLSQIYKLMDKINLPNNNWTVEAIFTQYCNQYMNVKYLNTVHFIDRLNIKWNK